MPIFRVPLQEQFIQLNLQYSMIRHDGPLLQYTVCIREDSKEDGFPSNFFFLERGRQCIGKMDF